MAFFMGLVEVVGIVFLVSYVDYSVLICT